MQGWYFSGLWILKDLSVVSWELLMELGKRDHVLQQISWTTRSQSFYRFKHWQFLYWLENSWKNTIRGQPNDDAFWRHESRRWGVWAEQQSACYEEWAVRVSKYHYTTIFQSLSSATVFSLVWAILASSFLLLWLLTGPRREPVLFPANEKKSPNTTWCCVVFEQARFWVCHYWSVEPRQPFTDALRLAPSRVKTIRGDGRSAYHCFAIWNLFYKKTFSSRTWWTCEGSSIR